MKRKSILVVLAAVPLVLISPVFANLTDELVAYDPLNGNANEPFEIPFTAQSEIVEAVPLLGDLTGDDCVDMNDIAVFAEHWLESGTPCECCIPADLTGDDCIVDFRDFAILASRMAKYMEEFRISIDCNSFSKWGFKYPVTYVFAIPQGICCMKVYKNGQELHEYTSNDFFNGVEGVRFDYVNGKAYVSAAFNETNTIDLAFSRGASYISTAKYYDDRKATYVLTNDNWGRSRYNCRKLFVSITDDTTDKYQAACRVARSFNIPITMACNTEYPTVQCWNNMQTENDLGGVERAVHTRTHPCNRNGYLTNGFVYEIAGCKDDIEGNIVNMPYGNRVLTFILPCGYDYIDVMDASDGHFLVVRDYGATPITEDYMPYPISYGGKTYGFYYKISPIIYDDIFQTTDPWGIYDETPI